MAAAMAGTSEDFPSEIQDQLSSFDDSLTKVEDTLKPLLMTPLNEVHEKLNPLDCAKVNLVAAYAVNSLFWTYLNVRGENPKEHPVKQELDRIRGYMNRVKEIQEKEKAPKLDKPASKRFVKSALWQAAHAKASAQKDDGASTSQADTSRLQPQPKRQRLNEQNESSKSESGKKEKRTAKCNTGQKNLKIEGTN
ncbi:nuclear nucleic acid-binding protein C1D [Lingula anatina]|uniref:Nuclear nucleic acid-binding protein C1D n=1 Tax=Lingula anatina TaxID=7574 RepID=A0A2R2MU34_LINAN|nr:nuclear nucleic acid-binding protein C1D [Lingula anatina]|eukprot:XP_023933693.1 nuclear nucleic acid-binding protein C1D [Lingula anatina]